MSRLFGRGGSRLAALVLMFGVVLASLLAPSTPQTRVAPGPTPTSEPSASKQALRAWRFERSLLASADPSAVGSEVRAALALPDGGWLLSVEDHLTRCLAVDSWSCHMLSHVPATLVRVDGRGVVMTERHDAPAIYRSEVFATRNAAVIQFGGGLYAIDLDTLATVATFAAPNIGMSRSGDRLYTWETYRRAAGATDLIERDPVTFDELQRFPDVTLDGLFGNPVVLPDHNAIAYTWPISEDQYAARVLPLDPHWPTDVAWLGAACGIERIADQRVAVSRGAACGSADQDRLLELRDTRDGHVVASAQGGFVSYWGASSLVVDGDRLIDPVTGAHVPSVPGWAVAVADGRAIARMADGGAALFRLDAVPSPVSHAPVVVAQATCSWPDFARVAIAQVENIGCQELRTAAAATRLVVSAGRQPTASSTEVTSVETDPSRWVMTIRYAQSVTSRWAGPTAQVTIVQLPDVPAGEWLVWLIVDGGRPDYGNGSAFEVTLP